MSFDLNALTPAAFKAFSTIIDVRSPAEYAEDHVPGAVSMPVFSNEERAEIGTIYVQQSPFLARKLGAAIVARNAAYHVESKLIDYDGSWVPLVYCWRGGQRSGAFTSILQQIGWRAQLIGGGYQTYRRLVVAMLYETPLPHKFILLDGNTGTGKTAILAELAAQGAQVIDLEGLAEHRGSLLGGLQDPQPMQKMFETRLSQALLGCDPSKPIFVEAESSKVGERLIPSSVWKTMRAAPRITISAPLGARADYLVRAYADALAIPAIMGARLNMLRALCGHARVDHWLDLLNSGRLAELAADLMQQHYDPSYARGRKAIDAHVLGTIETDGLHQTDFARIAEQIQDLTH